MVALYGEELRANGSHAGLLRWLDELVRTGDAHAVLPFRKQLPPDLVPGEGEGQGEDGMLKRVGRAVRERGREVYGGAVRGACSVVGAVLRAVLPGAWWREVLRQREAMRWGVVAEREVWWWRPDLLPALLLGPYVLFLIWRFGLAGRKHWPPAAAVPAAAITAAGDTPGDGTTSSAGADGAKKD